MVRWFSVVDRFRSYDIVHPAYFPKSDCLEPKGFRFKLGFALGYAVLGIFLPDLTASAEMDDRAFVAETAGVVVTNVLPRGVDLGAKTTSNSRYVIAGVPLDVTGEGTRCGSFVHSVEIAGPSGVRLFELRVPRPPVSNCPLPERKLKMILPVSISDTGGSLKTFVKLREARMSDNGTRVYAYKVVRVDYIRNGEGVAATVQISDPYHETNH